MKLTIANQEELDKWLSSRTGQCLYSIKGPAPEGATYFGGDPITRPVNVTWVDADTGDRFDIQYLTGDPDELDEDDPLWVINEQIKGLLEGVGASEDHEDVIKFLLSTGLPRSTVDRMHRALVWGDNREHQPLISCHF